MFTNINPLTPRKIEKAFAPIPGLPAYALMHTHSALRPPHMLNSQPHVYAVSSERISNTRGGPLDEPPEGGEPFLDPAFSQYVVTGEILEPSPGPPHLTAEQVMEADAARALEELAVASRMDGWHGMPESNPSADYPTDDRHSPTMPPHPFGPPPFPPYNPAITPLSSAHSLDHNMDAHGSELDPDEEKEEHEAQPGDDSHHTSYYRDAVAQPAPIRRFVAYNPRKRVTGVPVPIPHLTKPSRGRRVPTAAQPGSDDDEKDDVVEASASPPISRSGTGSPYGTRSAATRNSKSTRGTRLSVGDVPMKTSPSTRSYVCQVEGCGKAFRRGEHLKRHIRSLHTHEKPERCTYPGCGKEFSRKDNMQQHLKIHTASRQTTKRIGDSERKTSESDESDNASD